MKKVLSVVLALAMVFAIAAPAFAAEQTVGAAGEAGSVQVDGSTHIPPVKVLIPAATGNTVIVNPYGLDTSADDSGKTDIIQSAPLFVESQTLVDLNMSVSVTGTPAGKAVFSATPIASATKAVTTKSVFMYLNVKASTKAEKDDPDTVAGIPAYDKASASQVVVAAAKPTVKANILQIPKATADDGTGSSYAVVQLGGDASTTPSEPWTEEDKVSVAITFTFAPTTIAA